MSDRHRHELEQTGDEPPEQRRTKTLSELQQARRERGSDSGIAGDRLKDRHTGVWRKVRIR